MALPELTDEVVGEVLIPYGYDDVDIRDAIVEVLNAMGVSFVDKTTCKRKPMSPGEAAKWSPVTAEYLRAMLADPVFASPQRLSPMLEWKQE